MSHEALQVEVGARMRAARERLGLSQAEVARAAGLSPNVYGLLERGEVMASLATLREVAVALGESTDALLALERDGGAALVAVNPDTKELLAAIRGWPAEQVRLLTAVVRLIAGGG